MRSNTKKKSGTWPSDICTQDTRAKEDYADGLEEEGHLFGSPMDELLLKFEVNDKGVGRILLPPSLSALLQSDRISIAPFAGGLFIRSV